MIELAGIVILGIVAQWVAWRLKLPAILPLILIGLLVGPISTLFTEDGAKLIEPIWNGSKGLFPGEGLYYFVSLAISIILFEGGLTLRRSEVANVGPVITKLITLGTLVTFFGAGIAAHFIFGLSWQISFLFSGLIIVTGPTVITPILRNIPLKKDVSAVLKWEGILIDPIGALVAVLVYEFISVGAEGGAYTKTALIEFGKILLFGLTFGFTFAHALAFVIKKNFIPHYLLNVVALSTVLGVFVMSDIFAKESGLLGVVVMGMVMGNTELPNLKELLYFKESLSVLLISILFIVLAANIDLVDLQLIYNWNTALLFAIIVFLIRPLGVFLSSLGSHLSINERLFIGWVGPRGIVAAGIASLFGSKLIDQEVPGAEFITPLVFVIVLGTVLLNATTARLFAQLVGVFLKKSEGILIIGAAKPSRLIGQYLMKNNRHVVLIDSNQTNVEKSRNLGLEALTADIYSDTLSDNIELSDIGYLMSLTPSSVVNKYAIEKFRNQFGEHGSFRLVDADEMNDPENNPKEGLFSHTDDFIKLMEATRHYPAIHEIDLKDRQHYEGLIEITKAEDDIIPLFLKDPEGDLIIIPSYSKDFTDITEGFKLVYLGKVFDLDKEEDEPVGKENGKQHAQADKNGSPGEQDA
ncbi:MULTISPECIES: cation:proton antiporter [Robiginitalea]|uniref:Na(+):H(+) antiporter, CPA1 family protein n=1 Tax=Robiginitalea biformata (strain ATCC BAA-864 / DSM 15991 / KCTC 12146 / HTCC2501) TaxID=313596 RepID=A4CI68_ROBBH|nr:MULTISPECIES: sodium:proton antiporter [Robiginitalea]EAR16626.1 Na(+):H(+) antiporter, CPA1 family protein [Robiginitalea biformata HTCC2501]MDC6353139.1 sodium:proton antiporter [Robiginitalea sp. PM2]MDC6373694.1 sodium:proton antiporter [Robiginitalea sp. SP8]